MQNVNAHVVASHKLFEWKQILNKCDNYVSMKMLFFFTHKIVFNVQKYPKFPDTSL